MIEKNCILENHCEFRSLKLHITKWEFKYIYLYDVLMSAGMSTEEITQKQLKPPEVKSPDGSWLSVFGLILK